MATPVSERATDTELWRQVAQGSVPAFEEVVRRHQSAVCAVAYSACGDLATSEDVAQETFWAAWRERAALADPGRLRAWLCGIARNLASNARRRASRPADAAAPLDAAATVTAAAPAPEEAAVSREEEALVWQALEAVPESYREPLVLYYREGRSVAEVARALELSEDAAKQRLSRGREALRDRVAELVEGALRRSRPGRVFTSAVLTGLTSGAAQAFAGGAAGAAVKAAGTGLAGVPVGAVLGPLGGLAGAWLGTWLPAQLAETAAERDYLKRAGRRLFLVSALFAVVLVVATFAVRGRVSVGTYLAGLAAWAVAFLTYLAVANVAAVRTATRLRRQGGAPNDAPLRVRLEAARARRRGQVHRSRATLFGWPLLDVNVSDPGKNEGRVARGWVAVGDDARGLLLAVGGRARGLIAFGGVALGVLSFGGVAVGLVSLGGVAVGGLAVGGLGVGALGVGGMGIGWQALGGGAIAWDTACGGGAVARRAAFGGAAVAGEYAVGGAAVAPHANDDEAKEVVLSHPLARAFGWFGPNAGWLTVVFVLPVVLLSLALPALMYRRAPPAPDRT